MAQPFARVENNNRRQTGWFPEHEVICKDCGDPFTTTAYNADRCLACRVKAKRAARRKASKPRTATP